MAAETAPLRSDRRAPFTAEMFDDPEQAYQRVLAIYGHNTGYLRRQFQAYAGGAVPPRRVRACYPYVKVATEAFVAADSLLAYGFVDSPGTYGTTITRPDLFAPYLREQLTQLSRNHGVPIEIGISDTPIPVHFAFPDGIHLESGLGAERIRALRDSFDVPDLAYMDDSIVNGTWTPRPGDSSPLALFTAPRIDYSLHRLRHYTATSCEHFQNFVLFTNYQFYVDEFIKLAHALMDARDGTYEAFVEPGNIVTTHGGVTVGSPPGRLPQMPAYHLKRPGHRGVTLVNIGVGPSNAKTATDHIAVLRPHAWVMLGHCAGVRNTQKLGDYVLAHGYVREDHVLDADLPTWVPIPALAEVQVALEQSVREITGLSGADLKRIMRTGTVATIDNRNWELRDFQEPERRLSQSRAIGLDMESATIAANGFRFRVPYGTLLCVSDKPLHGEIKLPGMADAFYRQQVDQHLQIGIRAMEKLADLGLETLHSRKLRSFNECAFQ